MAWSIRMEGYGGPAQPSPTIGQCLNGGLGWLEVECNRCKTLDAIQRPRDTPIWIEAALKCRSCKKGRYAPPVHMIKLTREREIAPTSGCIPMMIDEPRLTVSLPRTFRCWVCALAETAGRIPVPCNGGSDGHTNRDGSHRRYQAQFRCEERGRALEGRGALQGVDRRRLYRGGPYRVRRSGREAHV